MSLVIYCPRHPAYQALMEPRADCEDCRRLRRVWNCEGYHPDICSTNVTFGRRIRGRLR